MSEPERHLPLTPLSFQILVALGAESLHGYGIIKEIEAVSGEAFTSSTGTLYLAIHRLVDEGLVEVDRSPRDGTDSRRKYYRLTDLGRQIALAEGTRLLTLLQDAQTKRLLPGGPIDGLSRSPAKPAG